MKRVSLACWMWIAVFSASGQNTIGLPDIINYPLQLIKGAQNRQIRQDRQGRMYFANNEGVLIYNGISWAAYPLPNKSIVRSIEFGPDGRLYAGGQDEFGYFAPKKNGELEFHSLKYLLPLAERSFTDVWQIIVYRDWLFFQTSNSIYQVNEKNAAVYKSSHWKFISRWGEKLVAQDQSKGLLVFQNGIWTPFLTKSELPQEASATSLTEIGRDSALITTIKHGIYLLTANTTTRIRSEFLETLSGMNISASTMVTDRHIAIATNLGGCYIIDKQGNLVRSFTRKEGLQNNNILDVFLDSEKNLWLGLDNGIDFIAYNNAIKHIYPAYLNEGSGYSSHIYNNELYIGTSNGLYKVPLGNEQDLSYIKGNFELIPNTQGQVWNLSEVNGKLLLGHHDGGFVIENNTAKLIDNSSGFWTFQPFGNVMPSSLMVTGTYQGINFFSYRDGSFSNRNTNAVFESARFVVIDNGDIWVAHPYKGIFRVRLVDEKPVITRFSARQGVTTQNGNYIFKIKNSIILTTGHGIYEYNSNREMFEPSAYYNKIFGAKNIRYLKEDGSGNIWFVFEKTLGVVDNSGPTPQIIYFPELNNKFVAGFEHVNPINRNNVLIGGEKGFYHINYEQYKRIKYPLKVQITTVRAGSERDSILYGGYVNTVNEAGNVAEPMAEISHSWNSFYFQFASPAYGQQSNIEYSFMLDGFDSKWIEYSGRTEKEYTNIPAGSYTFKVKARNNLGSESEISTYRFTVLPPWYQSRLAYVIYFILFGFAGWAAYKYQRKQFLAQQLKHEEEQKRLQYLHQLELEKAEKELVKLRNEKLEAEISHKNTELASTAMHLVQKGELLGKIKEQMLKIRKNGSPEKDSEDLKKILRSISEEDKLDEQWEQFTMHFDKVHSNFLVIIRNRFPNLTANELKLCAYLRMNLSTKEIAQLMNISVRGVEISRYRLRKKLRLATEVNLFDFLIEAGSEMH
ncbi:MAG TPA: triple tyrosine motif-containing protein [Chitinophagaceae bacterium]